MQSKETNDDWRSQMLDEEAAIDREEDDLYAEEPGGEKHDCGEDTCVCPM